MIRPAEPNDATAIANIWNPLIRDSAATFNAVEKSPAEISTLIAERQSSGHGFWVAQEGGAVLGFATYAQFRGGVGYARTMEHTIILAETARGKGIGLALMAVVEAHAKSAGAHSMFAGISFENQAGINFHARLGYKMSALLPKVGYKFGRYMDLQLMRKFL